ncbi:MAG: bifunctional folylpolyglutamate synthase/dihydrofolate synthase [Bacteroidales bacterium]|jgi:dihydrofolate synthase/folylpolyglutamate synthase|nr:bifunctional folylpolyglutamate synthase/dihydrofolate synthase [Bacteroidales bacterium]MBQ5689445.1 bifunctional folylpolyglutamate synthase/dihydrofolate synthase [Bacteroidales bacterium]
MNYSETLNWMFNKLPMYQRIGASAYKADLNTTINIINYLDNPQDSFKSIHIAGTNGKGSTSHSLASVFQEAGYKTGLYTSPHLRDFRERIRINGEMIPENEVVDFIGKHKDKLEELELSFFEMTVAMAFDYFRKEKVDIAIIEVGMGGRLDSTNVIKPELCVITNISLDHVKFLGENEEQIAAEKAGIIKPEIPVVIGETQEGSKDVFIKTAKEKNSPIFFADKIMDCRKDNTYSLDYQQFDIYKNNESYLKELKYPLLGNYQKKNLATVICALDILRDSFKIEEKHIIDGLANVIKNTSLMGRWQVINKNPLAIADTGHNVAGINEVNRQLAETKYNKLHFVLSVVNDKDIDGILQLLPKEAEYYFCKADIPRGLSADILFEKATNSGLKGKVYESVRNAYSSALANAQEGDLVFVGGSNFTVAEVV